MYCLICKKERSFLKKTQICKKCVDKIMIEVEERMEEDIIAIFSEELDKTS